MIGLLTWAAFGTWLPGPARGRIDPGEDAGADPAPLVPEPDLAISLARRPALKWPVVTLGPAQRGLVLADLARVARLRGFTPIVAVAAPNHVHVLMDVDAARSHERLVQLVKGSLSRTLSTAGGDAPARETGGARLPHHKWWTHQYSLRWVRDPAARAQVERRLRDHAAAGDAVRTEWA